MRTLLHKLFLASIAVATVAVATKPAMAASTVNVPFNFTVAGKICPAGAYSVKRDHSGNFITLSSQDASQSFQMVVGPGDSAPVAHEVVLKFDQQGDTRALRTIQYESQTTPRLDKKNRGVERIPTQDVVGQ
jgi:hypothetical protein